MIKLCKLGKMLLNFLIIIKITIQRCNLKVNIEIHNSFEVVFSKFKHPFYSCYYMVFFDLHFFINMIEKTLWCDVWEMLLEGSKGRVMVTWLKGLKVIWSIQTRRMSFWIMNTTLLSRWWLWIEEHGTIMCLKWTKWSTNNF